jgi:hypothetical protein
MLCALLLALAAWPLAARADDYGPRRDIVAIRHDFPILQRGLAMLDNLVVRAVVVESAVVDSGNALVQWRDANTNYNDFVSMRYRYGRWWLERDTFFRGDADPTTCPAWAPTPQLLSSEGVPPALVALAAQRMPVVQQAIVLVRQFEEKHSNLVCDAYSVGSQDPMYSLFVLPFQTAHRRAIAGGEYNVRVRLAQNDGPQDAEIAHIQGRAPTEGESWANPPSGNSYFFFSGTVKSERTVHVQAGTTLDVWFPFVLDPSLKYSLTIGGAGFTPIGPIDGTLADNTLHFVLPAFTAPPAVDMMGEIESD